MNLAASIMLAVLLMMLALAAFSLLYTRWLERRYPPVGRYVDVGGTRMHCVDEPADEGADLPPVVFIHGASANLLDQMLPLQPLLQGRARQLYFDRPGHGWSARGTTNETLYGQAGTIAGLMDTLGITDAVVVGHSFGGAVAAALALQHPEKVRGLVFLAAATHPWPGGATSWYYRLSSLPLLGRLFTATLAPIGGILRIRSASLCVFAPNRMPASYLNDAAIPLVLRPAAFRSNALDVSRLFDHVSDAARRYGEIACPAIVVSGNRDTVVYEEVHSLGLARDIPGAELVWVDNLGHKPEWVVPGLVVAAIEKAAGMPVDLGAAEIRAEAHLAGEVDGRLEYCQRNKPPLPV